ncbi:MAG: metallophosphoesterase [Verrucomicrobia bacterium]|nr:metallophosphoesterase [Verrucomicrobiota bacterium]
MPIHLPPLSRRQFIARSMASGAALLLSRHLFAAARTAADPHCWALLSDSHVAADRTKIARAVNLADRFATVVQEVLAWPQRPAGALIDGDLALDSGQTGDYATFADLLLPLRAAGIPLHLALGNHDNRERFWAALQQDKRATAPIEDKQLCIVRAARANWFVLDSLDKTLVTPGVLGDAQLAWLARSLDANADKPALVMVHHNPSTGGNKNGLVETEALFEIMRARRHVKAHFFGHSHRWSVEQDPSGLHLVNLPATSYPFDKQQPTGWVVANLEPQGVRLELRALDRAHAAHGRVHDLKWRS